jgi:AraC-like DNA-binding protein
LSTSCKHGYNGLFLNMRSRSLYIFLIFLFVAQFNWGQANPFARFVGKPYGTYHYALRDSLRKRYDGNNYSFVQRTVAQLRSLPDPLGDNQWKLEADFLESNYIHDYLHGSLQEFTDKLYSLLAESKKYHNEVFEVRILRRLLDLYIDLNDIKTTQSIIYARQMEKLLAHISTDEYPDALDCKFKLAEMYYKYKDYLRAEKYFKEIVQTPVIEENQRLFILSRNNLGLIQRVYYHNLDKADKWFSSVIDFDRVHHIKELRDEWYAITMGNLGKDQFLRHRYAQAEPMMRNSFQAMYRAKDYHFSFYMAADLADCYCEMAQYAKALHFLNLADSCYKKRIIPLSRQSYFSAMSKYYSWLGNPQKASLYLDSAFIERNAMDSRYNMKNFLNVEQQMSQMEWNQKNAESQANYHKFLIILFIAIIISAFLVSYIILYIRKKQAYQALALKSQEWAEHKPSYLQVVQSDDVSQNEEDNKLIKDLQDYIENSRCYCDTDVSLEMLCKQMGVNRTYLSNAIHNTNDNFSSLINRYRIRYAIQLLTANNDRKIEDVALATGFNNRKSFYNAFRNITGLSPTQFKSSMTSVETN